MGFNPIGLVTVADLDDAIANLPSLEDGTETTIDDALAGILSVDLSRSITRWADADAAFTSPLVNNNAERSMLNPAFTSPSNLFQSGSKMFAIVSGSYINNTGGTPTTTLRYKADATTIFSVAISIAADVNFRLFRWVINLQLDTFIGLNANGSSSFNISVPSGSTVTDPYIRSAGPAAVTINAADELTWDVTAQHSTASPDLSITVTQFMLLYGTP